jgi:hypothetical protein
MAHLVQNRLLAPTVLVAASLLLNGFLISRGARTGNDSAGYLAGGQALLEGDASVGRPGGWYLLKAAIAGSEALTGGLTGLLVLQVIVAGLACLAVYALTAQLNGVRAGVFAGALLIADLDIARFHAYVLTDSLYTSLVPIAVLTIYWADERGPSWRHVVALGVAGLCAALRPNGWLMPVVALGYWSYPAFRRRPWLIGPLAAGAVAATVWVLAPTIGQVIDFEDPGGYLQRGEVVADLHTWLLPMPQEAVTTTLADYMRQHPAETFALGVARVGAELAHVRPVYSAAHNALIFVMVAVVYPLAAVGFWLARTQRLAQLMLATIVTQLLIVFVTGADWDGRYVLFVFPLVLGFAGCGIARVQASLAGRWRYGVIYSAADRARG